jgi:hypothetical protein
MQANHSDDADNVARVQGQEYKLFFKNLHDY